MSLNSQETSVLSAEIDKLKKILPKGKLLGLTFETEQNKYFYDTVTGKVLICNEAEYKVFEKLLSGEIDEIYYLATKYDLDFKSAINNVLVAIKEENLLSISKFEQMCIPDDYEDMLSNKLNQVILELTEQCNLRCGYCIYNDDCNNNRNFGFNDMSKETAIKAIDFAIEHSKSSEDLHITFYGGEPLIKYDLLRECINYSKSIKPDNKNLHFAFTTNGVLMTKKIADELAREENVSIMFSIDGPKHIHDFYRKDLGGKGSFDRAIKGLQYTVESFGDRAEDSITLSMVYAPPFSKHKIEEIQEFFEYLEWLPKGVQKFISYPNEDSLGTISRYLKDHNISLHTSGNDEYDTSLRDWSGENYKNENLFSARILNESFMRINQRSIFSKIIPDITLNGCCIPGQRRIYVTVDGNFKICERIGSAPNIGNIEDGLNINNIKQVYLLGHKENSQEECSTCWLARLCDLCYVHAYDEDGFNFSKKESHCALRKDSYKRYFQLYFTILEEDPNAFDYMKELVTT
ncbi:radical SAM protein [Paenibacillus faecis]|uniref:radical SAM/SPASM domain-containing protein n=1 Tax=Paenibacillus faecis TaxID=862114 RepID=UPI001B2B5B88|nr:radical SAM protein [Paenibacillus faecis]GIO84645.1 radical SAM protein [Paenibacillus faecis]